MLQYLPSYCKEIFQVPLSQVYAWTDSTIVLNCSGALRTGSRQKTGIEHQHSRTHIMKARNETNFIVLVDVLLT